MMRRKVYCDTLTACALWGLLFSRVSLYSRSRTCNPLLAQYPLVRQDLMSLLLIHLLIFLSPRPPSCHTKTWFSYCRLHDNCQSMSLLELRPEHTKILKPAFSMGSFPSTASPFISANMAWGVGRTSCHSMESTRKRIASPRSIYNLSTQKD